MTAYEPCRAGDEIAQAQLPPRGAAVYSARTSRATKMDDDRLTLSEVAPRTCVTPATLRRWAESGVIPEADGATKDGWTPAAAAHAPVVARPRERGPSLEQIPEATKAA